MDNIVKFKLSQYSNIKNLNSDGSVVLSYDLGTDRVCVKKLVHSGLAEIYVKLKNIKCEYLPEIYDIIEYEDNCLIVEEYIKGRSIEEIVTEKRQIDKETACKYFVDIAEVLEVVHNNGIIHRDISPDNVIVDENNRAILLDFGIARVGNKKKNFDTTILGTAGFASPEQFGFAQTDARSDIYSMGVLLNYMLTGHIVQMGVYDIEPLKSIIIKATDIQPNLRYVNILEMKEEIFKCTKIVRSSSKFEDMNYINNLSENKYDENTATFSSIPGFRTRNPKRMVIAACIYVMYVFFFIGLISDHNGAEYVFSYMLAYLILFIIPIWWFGGNGSQWNIIPGMAKLKYDKKRILAAIIYFMVPVVFCCFWKI